MAENEAAVQPEALIEDPAEAATKQPQLPMGRGPVALDEPAENRDEQQVSLLAYQFWMERGCPVGTPDVDWFRAEEDIRNRMSMSVVAGQR